MALGIRQLRDENWQYYPWMNAPPGRPQRMGVFFLLSPGAPDTALAHVLRYTNGDRFRALDGYKTLSTHWHLADTVQAMANGFDWTPPFKPVLKAMGVDASMIMDFHGDGHPDDLTDLRLDELHAYFGALRAQSDPDFLLIPARGSQRAPGRTLDARLSEAGVLVHGLARRTAPSSRTIRSTARSTAWPMPRRCSTSCAARADTCTRRIRGRKDRPDFRTGFCATDYFRDASYLGAGWKALPSDLSSPRLGDRAFDLIDELNNQGLRKRLLGEVDVFQFDHTHELYAHMNINYIKLDRLPAFDRWGDALAPLAKGEFFTTTGEVLLPEVDLASSSGRRDRGEGSRAVDVPASVCGDRLGRRPDHASRSDRAGGHARVRQQAVRMASQGERLDMGPGRGVGCRRERRVREPVLAAVASDTARLRAAHRSETRSKALRHIAARSATRLRPRECPRTGSRGESRPRAVRDI